MRAIKKNKNNKPILECSVDSINVTLKQNEQIEGKIHISNVSEGTLKGQIFSPVQNISFSENFFTGECDIYYKIKTSNSTSNLIKSYIQIISNGGTLKIPVVINSQKSISNAIDQNIKDLYGFIDVCIKDWNEAVKLFVSDTFRESYLTYQPELSQVYNLLVKSSVPDQALEEFLIFIQKKQSPNILIASKEKKYKMTKTNLTDEIIIKKNGWGYIEVDISTNESFIRIEEEYLSNNSFFNNEAIIYYSLNKNRMHYGWNEGYIELKTVNTTDRVIIKAYNEKSISAYADQLSYTIQDEGNIIVCNPFKQKATIKIVPKDKWIELDKETYEIIDTTKIPIYFKQQQPKLSGWLKSNFLTKQLIVKSGLNVKINFNKNTIEKEIPVNIALHTIVKSFK